MNSTSTEDSRLGVPLLCLVVAAGFVLAVFKINNYDIWWHMKAGEYLLKNGGVPRTDVFSALAAGRKWVNPSWLADVVLYGIYKTSGTTGLIVCKALVAAVIAGILFLAMRLRGVRPGVCCVVSVLGLVCARPRMFVRPLMLTFLFVVVLLYLIERHRRRGSRLLYAIPCLMALWVNLHAGFAAGLVIVALYAVTYRSKQVAAVAGLTFLASLINPFFHEALLYPVRLLGLEFIRDIREWMPPDFELKFFLFWCMLVALSVTVLLSARTIGLFDLLLVLAFAVLAIQARRNIAVFALVSAPVLATTFSAAVGGRRIIHPPVAIAASLVMVGLSLRFSAHHVGLGVVEEKLPRKAVDFVLRHNIPGDIFNEYEWGGYILWRAFPLKKVCMDGRCLVYGDKLYREWCDIYYGRRGWDGLLRKLNVGILILDFNRADRGQAMDALGTKDVEPFYENRQWKVIYWDTMSMVCVRDVPENQEMISKYLCEASNPGTLWRVIATGKGVDRASAEIERKIKEDPSCAIAYDSLGQLLMMRHRLDEAILQFRKCLALRPDYALAHYHLGVCYYRKEQFRDAIAAYRRAVDLQPAYAPFHHNLGDAYLKDGRPFAAEEEYRRAIRYDAGLWLTWKNLAICCERTGRIDEAIENLKEANRLSGGIPTIKEHISLLEKKLGRR
ncbi:MAG: tetratricopeptide repeat protein [Planctomycetes bacterium]|nr:tetratricopeptide repeat protein [Planctomycetota bacterium]